MRLVIGARLFWHSWINCCWADQAHGQVENVASLGPIDSSQRYLLTELETVHFSSINEDLLLYWLMVARRQIDAHRMESSWGLKNDAWEAYPREDPQSSLINNWGRQPVSLENIASFPLQRKGLGYLALYCIRNWAQSTGGSEEGARGTTSITTSMPPVTF